MKLIDVNKKTMPYVHCHVVYTSNNIDFIQEWYDTCIKLGNIHANWDETILNVLFWKYKCNKYINYVYDPYYTHIYDILNIDKWKCYINKIEDNVMYKNQM